MHLDCNAFVAVSDFDVMDPVVVSPHVDAIRAANVSATTAVEENCGSDYVSQHGSQKEVRTQAHRIARLYTSPLLPSCITRWNSGAMQNRQIQRYNERKQNLEAREI